MSSPNNVLNTVRCAHSDAPQRCCSAPVSTALACYFIKVCLLRRCRKEKRNMEEFQGVAKSQQMGAVVLRRIVRVFRVHGLMVSNEKGSAVFRNSSRGRSFRPKNWSFVEGKWQENEEFFKSTVTQTRCVFNRFR